MELMRSAPGSNLLPESEKLLFIEQFEKDIRFFQLFFLLISRSSPIKNVDLVWVEHGQSGRAGLRHLGITEALESPASRLLGCQRQNPHPAFCNVINGNGVHEAESCGLSDKAAEELVRQTGKSQVYRCHFGLIDIAVPVMMNGQHIATLFTGQVLPEKPSSDGFVQITKDVAQLNYLDLKQLEQAYWEVPVVSETDIRNITEVLEAFAEYLSNSCTVWRRRSRNGATRIGSYNSAARNSHILLSKAATLQEATSRRYGNWRVRSASPRRPTELWWYASRRKRNARSHST